MKKFKKIYIEITNVCNLSCDFCPKSLRKSEFMQKDTFSKILDQIKGLTNYIYFHVKGEPLLHPLIGEYLDLSHQNGYKVNITTNGTLIKQTGDKLISKPALRQINFSIHSLPENNQEQYLNDIFLFIKKAKENSDILFSLRLWNLDKNNKNKNKNLLELIEKEFNLKLEQTADFARGIKISDGVYLNQEYEFQWPSLSSELNNANGFCYGLRTQAAILVDGTVIPCCLDGEGIINLGNINNTNFSDIINSKRSKAIYSGFSQRKAVEELCKKCQYREKFSL